MSGKDDYLDKGLAKAEEMVGTKTGHKMDPAKMKSSNEKITDKVRDTVESKTGKNIPDKVSN